MAAARPKSLTSVKNWQILNAIVSKSAGTNNRARIAYTDTETRIPEYLPIAVKNAPEITFFKDDIYIDSDTSPRSILHTPPRSRYRSTFGYGDTIGRFFRYPPRTGGSVSSPIPP